MFGAGKSWDTLSMNQIASFGLSSLNNLHLHLGHRRCGDCVKNLYLELGLSITSTLDRTTFQGAFYIQFVIFFSVVNGITVLVMVIIILGAF